MYPAHPRIRAWQENRLQIQLWPCLVGPNGLPSPTRHQTEAVEAQQAAQEQLYREKLKPFQQMNREGASSTGLTSLGRRVRELLSDQGDTTGN